jgi:SpoVK/Ycf46/Vps4 family AAA+-type ATPase
MLNARPPKKISGSEVLSKWHGEGDRKIRELFQVRKKQKSCDSYRFSRKQRQNMLKKEKTALSI